MQLTFSELRTKEVINTVDGRKLGRVCDVALCYPEYKWVGVIAPNSSGLFKKEPLFIEPKNIVKIGEDVILVNVGAPKQGGGKGCHESPPPPCPMPRHFDEFE